MITRSWRLIAIPPLRWSKMALSGIIESSYLLRQTPCFFDLAQSSKHFFVLFGDRRGFRHAEKLNVVPMGAVHDHERRPAGRPAAMLAVVTQGFRRRERCSAIFLGYVRGVLHQ